MGAPAAGPPGIVGRGGPRLGGIGAAPGAGAPGRCKPRRAFKSVMSLVGPAPGFFGCSTGAPPAWFGRDAFPRRGGTTGQEVATILLANDRCQGSRTIDKSAQTPKMRGRLRHRTAEPRCEGREGVRPSISAADALTSTTYGSRGSPREKRLASRSTARRRLVRRRARGSPPENTTRKSSPSRGAIL